MDPNIIIILISIISLALIGGLSGVLLAFASEKFKVERDPKVEEVLNLLPRANCGACGYPSCIALAEAIIAGGADPAACKVGGESTANKIAESLGKGKCEVKERTTAHVFCGGSNKNCGKKFEYNGISDCDAVLLVGGGNKLCSYGCLGYGACAKVCKFDALKMGSNGLPVINPEKCVACGKCIVACPKKIIGYIPRSAKIAVNCSTKDKGAYVRKICKVGCIACKMCEKACAPGAITMRENLPVIDYNKCTACLECVRVCPMKTIVEI
ncbi:MAG: RnfABCDGE type electron transport complex subunit B [bacterium]